MEEAKLTLKGFFWAVLAFIMGSIVSFLDKDNKVGSSLKTIFLSLSPYDFSLIFLSLLVGLMLDYAFKDEKHETPCNFCFIIFPIFTILIFIALIKGKQFRELNNASVFNWWNFLIFVEVGFLKTLLLKEDSN